MPRLAPVTRTVPPEIVIMTPHFVAGQGHGLAQGSGAVDGWGGDSGGAAIADASARRRGDRPSRGPGRRGTAERPAWGRTAGGTGCVGLRLAPSPRDPRQR